jgi:carboxyl-terminal processing protease
MKRAAAVVLSTAFFTATAWPKEDPWAKDLDFLVEQLGKGAETLLKQKGVDWTAVDHEFHASLKSVKSDSDFVKLAIRLVARLRDGHATLTNLKVQPPDESKGRKWGAPGVFLLVSGNKVFVRNAWGPAAERGLAAGMEVNKIDGQPARKWLDDEVAKLRDTTGFSTDHQALYAACHWGLGDWEGAKITFDVVKDKAAKSVSVLRDAGVSTVPEGPAFAPKDLKSIGRQSYGKTAKGFGYIHLRDAPEELPDQLDTMLDAIGDVPGLVLDCRANGGGGCDHAKVFGRFLAAGEKWTGDEGAKYVGEGKRPFTGPMVVIVDAGVRSTGETVSGMFKEDGRAYMIGDTPTAGMSSQKKDVTVPSGLFGVHFSVRSNKQRFNGGKGIEGIGVAPHELVPYDAADLAAGVDTEIRRAEELLAKGFPGGKVLYKSH